MFDFLKCVTEIETSNFLSQSLYYSSDIGLQPCTVAYIKLKQMEKLLHTLTLLKVWFCKFFQLFLHGQ